MAAEAPARVEAGEKEEKSTSAPAAVAAEPAAEPVPEGDVSEGDVSDDDEGQGGASDSKAGERAAQSSAQAVVPSKPPLPPPPAFRLLPQHTPCADSSFGFQVIDSRRMGTVRELHATIQKAVEHNAQLLMVIGSMEAALGAASCTVAQQGLFRVALVGDVAVLVRAARPGWVLRNHTSTHWGTVFFFKHIANLYPTI